MQVLSIGILCGDGDALLWQGTKKTKQEGRGRKERKKEKNLALRTKVDFFLNTYPRAAVPVLACGVLWLAVVGVRAGALSLRRDQGRACSRR